MKTITSLAALMTGASALCSIANAQIPVTDAASIANDNLTRALDIVEQARQYAQMVQDFENQISQLTNLEDQLDAMTGTRGMGSLLNGVTEQGLRRYIPEDMNALLDLSSAAGGNTADAKAVFDALQADYGHVDPLIIDPTGGPVSLSADRRTRTTFAAMATAEGAYNQIRARTEAIEDMLTELDATTDVKASTDLQARIAAESALIENERLRLQSVQLQQTAATENEELVRQSQASRMNTPDFSGRQAFYDAR